MSAIIRKPSAINRDYATMHLVNKTSPDYFNASIEIFTEVPMYLQGVAMHANVWRTSPNIRRVVYDA